MLSSDTATLLCAVVQSSMQPSFQNPSPALDSFHDVMKIRHTASPKPAKTAQQAGQGAILGAKTPQQATYMFEITELDVSTLEQ